MNILNALIKTTMDQNKTENKGGFLKRAFNDMKENARLQGKADKAKLKAAHLETKAFFMEQKSLSSPSARTTTERERMQAELEAANQRISEAQDRIDSLKK